MPHASPPPADAQAALVAAQVVAAPLAPVAVDASEAAAMLGISRSTFYVLLRAKRLPPPRIACGRLRRWSVADIARVAAEGLADPAVERARGQRRGSR